VTRFALYQMSIEIIKNAKVINLSNWC